MEPPHHQHHQHHQQQQQQRQHLLSAPPHPHPGQGGTLQQPSSSSSSSSYSAAPAAAAAASSSSSLPLPYKPSSSPPPGAAGATSFVAKPPFAVKGPFTDAAAAAAASEPSANAIRHSEGKTQGQTSVAGATPTPAVARHPIVGNGSSLNVGGGDMNAISDTVAPPPQPKPKKKQPKGPEAISMFKLQKLMQSVLPKTFSVDNEAKELIHKSALYFVYFVLSEAIDDPSFTMGKKCLTTEQILRALDILGFHEYATLSSAYMDMYGDAFLSRIEHLTGVKKKTVPRKKMAELREQLRQQERLELEAKTAALQQKGRQVLRDMKKDREIEIHPPERGKQRQRERQLEAEKQERKIKQEKRNQKERERRIENGKQLEKTKRLSKLEEQNIGGKIFREGEQRRSYTPNFLKKRLFREKMKQIQPSELKKRGETQNKKNQPSGFTDNAYYHQEQLPHQTRMIQQTGLVNSRPLQQNQQQVQQPHLQGQPKAQIVQFVQRVERPLPIQQQQQQQQMLHYQKRQRLESPSIQQKSLDIQRQERGQHQGRHLNEQGHWVVRENLRASHALPRIAPKALVSTTPMAWTSGIAGENFQSGPQVQMPRRQDLFKQRHLGETLTHRVESSGLQYPGFQPKASQQRIQAQGNYARQSMNYIPHAINPPTNNIHIQKARASNVPFNPRHSLRPQPGDHLNKNLRDPSEQFCPGGPVDEGGAGLRAERGGGLHGSSRDGNPKAPSRPLPLQSKPYSHSVGHPPEL